MFIKICLFPNLSMQKKERMWKILPRTVCFLKKFASPKSLSSSICSENCLWKSREEVSKHFFCRVQFAELYKKRKCLKKEKKLAKLHCRIWSKGLCTIHSYTWELAPLHWLRRKTGKDKEGLFHWLSRGPKLYVFPTIISALYNTFSKKEKQRWQKVKERKQIRWLDLSTLVSLSNTFFP